LPLRTAVNLVVTVTGAASATIPHYTLGDLRPTWELTPRDGNCRWPAGAIMPRLVGRLRLRWPFATTLVFNNRHPVLTANLHVRHSVHRAFACRTASLGADWPDRGRARRCLTALAGFFRFLVSLRDDHWGERPCTYHRGRYWGYRQRWRSEIRTLRSTSKRPGQGTFRTRALFVVARRRF